MKSERVFVASFAERCSHPHFDEISNSKGRNERKPASDHVQMHNEREHDIVQSQSASWQQQHIISSRSKAEYQRRAASRAAQRAFGVCTQLAHSDAIGAAAVAVAARAEEPLAVQVAAWPQRRMQQQRRSGDGSTAQPSSCSVESERRKAFRRQYQSDTAPSGPSSTGVNSA